MTETFFFYGTLKRGQAFHGRLLAGNRGARFVRDDAVRGWGLQPAFGALVPSVPATVAAAVRRDGGYEIRGEVFELRSDRTIRLIDLLESGYARQRVVTESGIECTMYVGHDRGGPLWEEWPFRLQKAVGT